MILPSGLAPGQQYLLIFHTISSIDATSSDIGVYNDSVTAQAGVAVTLGDMPDGLTWHAVVSTAAVNARDNAPSVNLPVYNTHGDLVATKSIYDGQLLAPVVFNQFGSPYYLNNASVWTGSDQFGLGIPGLTLGGPGDHGETGLAGGATEIWLHADTHVGLAAPLGIYALSSPITYVPEPGVISLIASALVALGGLRVLQLRRRG